jgi:hypothetical protein
LTDKDLQEPVLAWLAALLEASKPTSGRGDGRPLAALVAGPAASPLLLSNLASVLLQLCDPFIRVADKPHQVFHQNK